MCRGVPWACRCVRSVLRAVPVRRDDHIQALAHITSTQFLQTHKQTLRWKEKQLPEACERWGRIEGSNL